MTSEEVKLINSELAKIWESLDVTRQGIFQTICDELGLPIFKEFSVDFYNSKSWLSEKAYAVLTDRLLADVAADVADIIATIDNYSIGGASEKTKQLLADFRKNVTMVRLETTWNYRESIPKTYWIELNALFAMLPMLQNDLQACRLNANMKGNVQLSGIIDWILYNVNRDFELIKKYRDKTKIGYVEQ